VDGTPDTIAPSSEADVANGAYGWQQLSGPQGTISTVVGADTDIPDARFANYYEDDLTPADIQCGGDGKAIGSSGFGILGSGSGGTPNTDPRLGTAEDPADNLTVKRTRYFGPPSDGANEAAGYKNRVEKPLTASVTPFETVDEPTSARLKMKLVGKKGKAKKGKSYSVRVRVSNTGATAARNVKVCAKSAALKRGGACKTLKSLAAGKSKVVVVKTKVKAKAKGKKMKVRVSVKSGKSSAGKSFKVPFKR